MNHDYDIKYDFYPIQCTNSMTINNVHGKYVQGNYLGKLNQPNIVLAKSNAPYTTYYQTTKLYLASSSNIFPHNAPHATIPAHDGQIILELEPSTTDKKLFVIFLLKYIPCENTPAPPFPIQKLLTTTPDASIPLEFNKYFPKPENVKIQAISPPMEDTVYLIFQNVIPIQENIAGKFTDFFQRNKVFDQPIQTDIFNKQVDLNSLPHPNQKALSGMVALEGFQEGMDASTNLVCELLDVPSDDIVQVLQVPMGSLGYNDVVSKGYGDVAMNMMYIFFVSILTFLIGPLFYVWVRNVLGRLTVEKGQMNNIGKFIFTPIQQSQSLNVLRSLDFLGDHPSFYEIVWFTIIMFGSISAIITGFATENLTAKVSGFFGLYLYFFMYLGIRFYYSSRPDERDHMIMKEGKQPYPYPPTD
jgi:hypothetical protein